MLSSVLARYCLHCKLSLSGQSKKETPQRSHKKWDVSPFLLRALAKSPFCTAFEMAVCAAELCEEAVSTLT